MNKNRIGTIHQVQPEVSDWILCADFQDDMPHDEPERHKWHNGLLLAWFKETGVNLLDLCVSKNEGDPDYTEVVHRLRHAGYDIYESDNYLEVYDHSVDCDSCADGECDNPQGVCDVIYWGSNDVRTVVKSFRLSEYALARKIADERNEEIDRLEIEKNIHTSARWCVETYQPYNQ